MINNLRIKNFVLIDDLDIDFSKGFNVLFGETGAGKSILVNALTLLSGARSQFDKLNDEKKKAIIEATFILDDEFISDHEYLKEYLDDNVLVLTRILSPNKVSTLRINGETVTLNILKRVANDVFSITSQGEQISLMNEKEQLNIVDKYVYETYGSEIFSEYDEKYNSYKKCLKDKEELNKYRNKATKTADSIEIELFGNIGKPEDAKNVKDNDGEGIGLFRTEFLFMENTQIPSEEEQFEAYKKTAVMMDGKEVIIRTLDVGGDKNIPYLGMEKEDNPFLGFRAVRYCLDRKEMYKIQLRALIRASVFGKIKIMIPLVTCVNELREVKVLVEDIKADLDRENIPYDKNISVGVMIETPAASEIADLLAKEADFFSIGTNDLTQYTMAVDRGNSKVAYLYSVYNPAVIRSIKRIISAAANENIIAGMCGEAAADPLLTPLLISFGLKEFSVNASSILRTRAQIAKWTKAEADKVADEVMKCATQEEVYEILKRYQR